MKIELTSYGSTFSASTENDDLYVHEIMQHFINLMICAKYQPESIYDCMEELVENYREDCKEFVEEHNE